MNEEYERRCLGLIGGLGVGAAIHYYKELARAHSARGAVANLVMVHADVNRVLKDAAAGDVVPLAGYLSQLLERATQAGARIGAMPAVTPHICMSELVKLSPIPMVSLVDEIAREIQMRGLSRVALFGTRFTMETSMFGQLRGVDVVMPKMDEMDFIHGTYLEILSAGVGSEAQYQGLRRVAHALCEREGVEAIVLAGTELSLVFNEANTDFPHIEGARVHIDAIMRRLFEE